MPENQTETLEAPTTDAQPETQEQTTESTDPIWGETEEIEQEQSTEEAEEEGTQETEDDAELSWGDNTEAQEEAAEPALEIDPIILSALESSPEAKARLEQQFAGLGKLQRQKQELAQEIEQFKPTATAFNDWVTKLKNPESRTDAVQEMRELIKGAIGEDPFDDGYRYEADADPVKPLIDPIKKELDELKAFQAELKREKAEAEWIQTHAPALIEGVKKKTGGWEVTPQMLIKARQQYPGIDPLRALKKEFDREYEAFKDKKGSVTTKAAPMLGNPAKGAPADLSKLPREGGHLLDAFMQ